VRKIEDFTAIMAVDSEYYQQSGAGRSRPVPLCFCALNLLSGEEYRLWSDEIRGPKPPWPHGPDSLLIAYSANAEMACYHVVGWDTSIPVFDLCTEYRQIVNGIVHKDEKRTLLAALEHFRLSGISIREKEYWRDVISTRGPFSAEQRKGILDYCWTNVVAARDLFNAMRPALPVDLSQRLYRDRYSIAAAMSELFGIPIDEFTLNRFREHREFIRQRIVKGCPVYDEGASLRQDLLETRLRSLGLLDTWPRTKTGLLSVEKQAFKDRSYIPTIEQVLQVKRGGGSARRSRF
jgi:hypothetical protein